MDPMRLAQLLDTLFKTFDGTVETYHLHKMDTVGDAYIVIGGLHDDEDVVTKCQDATKCALALQKAVLHMETQIGLPLSMRAGIHLGEAIGTVMGSIRLRHHLYGNVLHIAEFLESTSTAGRVHISTNVHAHLPDFVCEVNGNWNSKSEKDQKWRVIPDFVTIVVDGTYFVRGERDQPVTLERLEQELSPLYRHVQTQFESLRLQLKRTEMAMTMKGKLKDGRSQEDSQHLLAMDVALDAKPSALKQRAQVKSRENED